MVWIKQLGLPGTDEFYSSKWQDMATVRIPSLLREVTDGRSEVEASGRTLREVVRSLDAAYPGIRDRLIEDGNVRPELSFAVDGEVAEMGLLQPVEENSEIVIVPAISGGH